MTLRLAKDGWPQIAGATVILVGGAAVAVWACWPAAYGWLAAAPLLVVWLGVLYFFRDPDRVTPGEGGLFVSPADGVVSDITPVGADSELGTEGTRIGVFMSVLSVHVNRVPCDGEVTGVTHRPGRFRDVRDEQAWGLNEATTIRMNYDTGGRSYPVVVRQVAGLIARRIVCHARPGDRLRRGARFGLIKFGSRLELLLPAALGATVRVQVGQKVAAGTTVLAAETPGGPSDD